MLLKADSRSVQVPLADETLRRAWTEIEQTYLYLKVSLFQRISARSPTPSNGEWNAFIDNGVPIIVAGDLTRSTRLGIAERRIPVISLYVGLS